MSAFSVFGVKWNILSLSYNFMCCNEQSEVIDKFNILRRRQYYIPFVSVTHSSHMWALLHKVADLFVFCAKCIDILSHGTLQ